jgi:CBS domain-containing protein
MKSVKVRDYMNTNVVSFTPETDLFQAIGELLKRHISGAPVINELGELVGMLTEWDCMKRILHRSYTEEVGGKVMHYMRKEVHSISPNDDILDIAERMKVQDWHCALPVMEDNRLVGILSCPDILQVIYDFDTHKAA